MAAVNVEVGAGELAVFMSVSSALVVRGLDSSLEHSFGEWLLVAVPIGIAVLMFMRHMLLKDSSETIPGWQFAFLLALLFTLTALVTSITFIGATLSMSLLVAGVASMGLIEADDFGFRNLWVAGMTVPLILFAWRFPLRA